VRMPKKSKLACASFAANKQRLLDFLHNHANAHDQIICS